MKALSDKVISVPIEQNDVSNTIAKLPRHPDDAKIVGVQLKRKLEMKNTHLSEYIRPAKCIKAIEKLKELENPFYKDVVINKEFLQKPEVRNSMLIIKLIYKFITVFNWGYEMTKILAALLILTWDDYKEKKSILCF